MDTWSNSRFAAWLAGFFDGEGCIYLPPVGVAVSIASTDRRVIESLRRRLGYGLVSVVTFNRAEWKTKYDYRIRNYTEAGKFLRIVRPMLIIKAEKADRALKRIDAWEGQCRKRAKRNEKIVSLAASGVTHRKISSMFGLDDKGRTVSYIVRGIIRDGSHPLKAHDGHRFRNAHERTMSKRGQNGQRVRSHVQAQ